MNEYKSMVLSGCQNTKDIESVCISDFHGTVQVNIIITVLSNRAHNIMLFGTEKAHSQVYLRTMAIRYLKKGIRNRMARP